jgi:Fe-S cluster biogenesis protein NfuA
MAQAQPVYVSLEFTPNPNTLKYSVNRELVRRGAANFTRAADAEGKSALAVKLFSIAGICGVMLGRDFITVTKTEEGDWDLVHRETSRTIEEYLSQGLQPLEESFYEKSGSGHKGGDSELEKRIRDILDAEIRPAVAMDGGDITFDRFEDGVVYLEMQGSCAGCPSSTATLKMGIETRLKEAIPEVVEVVSV